MSEHGDLKWHKFCPSCNNLLKPKEDKTEKRLMYACRCCEHMEYADGPLVYHRDIEGRSRKRSEDDDKKDEEEQLHDSDYL